jgi:hypothetical protein
MEIKNVTIESTFLGCEDHGIFTFFLNVKGDGWGVGIGGYCIDEYDPDRKKRVFSKKGAQLIKDIIKTVGAKSWEDVKGRLIRVEDNGWGKSVVKFGHIMEDKWIDLSTYFENNKEEQS